MSNSNKQSGQYKAEFQESTVEYIKTSRKSLSQVSRELGVSVSTLSKWMKRFSDPQLTQQQDEDELTRLRLENKALKKSQAQQAEEIAILKKASAYFARQMQ